MSTLFVSDVGFGASGLVSVQMRRFGIVVFGTMSPSFHTSVVVPSALTVTEDGTVPPGSAAVHASLNVVFAGRVSVIVTSRTGTSVAVAAVSVGVICQTTWRPATVDFVCPTSALTLPTPSMITVRLLIASWARVSDTRSPSTLPFSGCGA